MKKNCSKLSQLTLRQLEDVLLPVHDPQHPLRRQLSDVPRVEQAVGFENLGSLLRVAVVSREDGRTRNADLPPRGVGEGVAAHLGDGLEAEAHGR